MATSSSVTATVSSDIAYVFTDSTAGSSVNESASLGYSLSLENGTSPGQVNAAVRYTGHLPSGTMLNLDFTAFPKQILGGDYNMNFTNVKGVVIENKWNGTGTAGITRADEIAYLKISSTGSPGGFTGLFAGEDGNIQVSPGCTWLFNDRFGVEPFHNNRNLTLTDISGSGIPVSVVVVGVTG